jgi:hypothetical protein
MAHWLVRNTNKKTVFESFTFTKGEATVIFTNGWRWGCWRVETSDDNEPDFSSNENDMEQCVGNIASIEMDMFEDGWVEEIDIEGCSEEDEELLRQMIDDDGVWVLVDELGWAQDDLTVMVYGPLEWTERF